MKSQLKSSANYLERPTCKSFSFIMLMFLLLNNPITISAQLSIQDVSISMLPNTNSFLNGVCQLTISDTTNCSFVAVELADGVSDSLIFFREFAFDQTTGLPGSLTWNRIGNVITIALGEFPLNAVWKARVRLKNASDNWGNWEEFIFN